ncbi:septum formation family protein [Catenuloplanes japonicus]|uniref:septum formation family protein n=1 Tax=Catenuloplanes japonicus TaxID=33876 RepID=UPI000691D8FB|nr:septum formation family protein [Catenuloplanes japonicus]
MATTATDEPPPSEADGLDAGTPLPDDPGATGRGARAVDVVAVLSTVGILITLAQLSAWRAVFSSIGAVGLAALLFATRYARGRWRVPLCVVLAFLSIGALVTVYLEPLFRDEAAPAPRVTATSQAGPLRVGIHALLPGDCIAGSDLILDNTEIPWPDSTEVVSCDVPHDGEVILASDPWSADAAFPGDTLDDLVKEQCRTAFRAYVGVELDASVLSYTSGSPDADTWADGNRHVYCVAYDPDGKLTTTVRRTGR